MTMLQKAEIAARIAHAGQIDKIGVPYTEHLKAVASMVTSEDEKVVAWLHDIIEDTPVGAQDLRSIGFPPYIVDAVILLTHAHNVSHEDYLVEIRDAPGYPGALARNVKRADMKHNADPTRDAGDWLRRRYEKGIAVIGEERE